jgi:hypothetical protein
LNQKAAAIQINVTKQTSRNNHSIEGATHIATREATSLPPTGLLPSTTHPTSWHNSPFPSNKHHTFIHYGLQVQLAPTFNNLPSKANGTPRFHQRDTNRSSLFSGYDQRSRPTSTSPNPYTASNGYSIPSSSSNNTFAAYPGGSSTERANSGASFRTATPDRRGAYSDAVLSELESQNDEQVSEMSKKVGMLKDVSISRVTIKGRKQC